MLFAIAFFGSLLLIPLYYQTVRGASALEAGLLLAPLGLGVDDHDAARRQAHRPLRAEPLAGLGIPLLVIGHRARSRSSPPTPPTSCSAASASCSVWGWGWR